MTQVTIPTPTVHAPKCAPLIIDDFREGIWTIYKVQTSRGIMTWHSNGWTTENRGSGRHRIPTYLMAYKPLNYNCAIYQTRSGFRLDLRDQVREFSTLRRAIEVLAEELAQRLTEVC